MVRNVPGEGEVKVLVGQTERLAAAAFQRSAVRQKPPRPVSPSVNPPACSPPTPTPLMNDAGQAPPAGLDQSAVVGRASAPPQAK